MEENDNFLIEKYLAGDGDAFKGLINKYTTPIYNFTVRFVGKDSAEDLVQDIFIKVWKNIDKFDSNRASFKTWVFTITRNTVTDYLRKKKVLLYSSFDKEEAYESNIEDEAVLPDEALIKLEDKDLLNSLLDKISPSYREVLILYYQEDMTFSEIGQLLDKPLNTVKSQHRRALMKLKEMLDERTH